jgi:hypothetical protein
MTISTLRLLLIFTVILTTYSKPIDNDYDHLIKAPGLEDNLMTHDFKEIAPYMMHVERITYCSNTMNTKSDTFLIGGKIYGKHEHSLFPEFECEKMIEDEDFKECALCYRTNDEATEPIYLLDMRFKHSSSHVSEAIFFVWSHPRNILNLPMFNDEVNEEKLKQSLQFSNNDLDIS